jgi:hypothetical protein
VISLQVFERVCDRCGRRIEGEGVRRYYRTFCSEEHVAEYFGANIEGEDRDFPTAEG